jgi:hypothetical protein
MCQTSIPRRKIAHSLFVSTKDGGEGGIRTRVGVISPQTAFEAAPLRPLRYLSELVCQTKMALISNAGQLFLRFVLKKSLRSWQLSSSRTPESTLIR